MPAPISILRTGTGWTVDVTTLQLSTNLGTKDFFIRHSGVGVSNTLYTKTSATLLTYTGVALATNTPVVIYRDSSRLVPDFTFAQLNTSSSMNAAFTQVEVVMEDLRQMLTTLLP